VAISAITDFSSAINIS